ncbi:hypothetical protein AtubIFM55763_007724 [Aspergillus tubingensis]|uniref:25S rRNA (Uridine(2843)-N(3))-methyltransferase n=1 Tax=Aspergillus tubingensis TaxID=5068 RepID=A0A9W6EHM7_ASPTU|nr:hypothetical protein AtubIFM55763_007724 [Aspergillus tubingensis]GLA79724.1 hypothetical protein AtubIFM56815_000525 [Aspergillus tubingensis]GLA95329.1 hypothetical protein AtubIFM57143_002334 [Aspergillus tubingensis]GLB16597.1 hypothetical protein AtubIFM61612_006448 [Aspergillus tubingensis]
MAPPRSGNTSKKPNKKESSKKKPSSSSSQAQPRRTTSKTDPNQHHHAAHQNHELNISTTIPLTLQQLLLNVFKTALLTNGHNYLHNREETKQNDDEDATTTEATGDSAEQQQQEQLDIKSLIQTIKTHLYNRDFDSAFTDANEDLLRAYALRWSSSRALGYAGIFRALLKEVIKPVSKDDDAAAAAAASTKNVVCIGGGAGAEIVALAAAWRDFLDGAELRSSSSASDEGQIADAVKAVSLDDGKEKEEREEEEKLQPTSTSATATTYPGLSVTAVDIADWSKVVERLSTAIRSPTVTGSKSHPAPLLSSNEDEEKKEKKTPGFNVQFEKLDVLSAGEKELQGLFSRQGAESCSTALVTLMFTLNELFSTSMAKATGFLLRMTDLLRPGTVLLVVDSPGSYSTLKLGKGGDGEVRERQYPMKFLLDHTLLSVAEGKWERLLSQDSRWWRRDAARLKYDVGEGAGLEDMRFQVHVYRRVGE